MKFEERKFAEGALYTDFYQLTMAQVYYRLGIHEKTAQFDYFFRSYPDYGLPPGRLLRQCRAGVVPGLGGGIQLQASRRSIICPDLKDRQGNALFAQDFLKWLKGSNVATGLDLQCHPRRARGASLRARLRGAGPAALRPAGRNLPAQPSQLSDPDRHQSRPHRGRRPGQRGGGFRHAPRAGPRRISRGARFHHRRRGGFFQHRRLSRPGLSTQRHACPQHGPGHRRPGRQRAGRL